MFKKSCFRLVILPFLFFSFIEIQAQFSQVVTEIPHGGRVYVADFNGDGYEDLLIAGAADEGSSWSYRTRVYRNNKNGTFYFNGNDFFSYPSTRYYLGDFDNDNDIDFIEGGIAWDYTVDKQTFLFMNNGNFNFSNAGWSIFPMEKEWAYPFGDYDSDGDLDVLYLGDRNENAKILENKSGIYKEMATSIMGMYRSEAAWGDYDNDGDLDIVVCGSDSLSNRICRIYRNDDGEFAKEYIALQGMDYGSLDWADFDGDGDLDLLRSGGERTFIYLNLGEDRFEKAAASGLPGTYSGNSRWGDYDLDGDLDVLFVEGYTKLVCENLGGLKFAAHEISALSDYHYWGEWIDYDNDGDLDVVLSGSQSTVVVKNTLKSHTDQPPSVPSGLTSKMTRDGLLLEWKASSDDISSKASIQYNVNIGSSPSAGFITAPMADPYSGKQYLRKEGNALFSEELLLKDVPVGTYYWAVQAIDNSGLASDFQGSYQKIEVTHPFSRVFQTTSSDGGAMCWGDYDDDGRMDVFAGGNVYRNQGESFTKVTNFEDFYSITEAEWVDYDNDGDLDICYSGYFFAGFAQTSRSWAEQLTIYKNENNTFVLDETLDVPGVFSGGFCWKDFNADGMKDLFISGYTKSGAFDESLETIQEGITRLYLNTRDDGLVQSSFPFSPDKYGYCYTEDLDSDQDFDIIHTNWSDSTISIYENNGDGIFSLSDMSIPFVRGTYVFNDHESDGDVDVLLSGIDEIGNKVTRLFRNTGQGFEEVYTNLPGISSNSVSWLDMDGDHDLDLFLRYGNLYYMENTGNDEYVAEAMSYLDNTPNYVEVGHLDSDWNPDLLSLWVESSNPFVSEEYLEVYRNNYSDVNLRPSPPENPDSELEGFDVVLSWDKPPLLAGFGDSLGYSYNIKVGTSPGGVEIVAPDSDPGTGFIRTMQRGNTSSNRSWRLKNLPLGTYYWSVQSINQSYVASVWSPEGTFTISEVSPDFESDVVCRGLATTFADYSVTSDVISGWKWEFGDGNISTTQNPRYIFSSAGTHQVTLWAYTQSGDSASVTLDVEVKESPEVLFETPVVCDRELMWFTDRSNLGSLSGISYSWDFGDEETSTTQSSVSHLYSDPGTYSATLTISADNGCSSQFSKDVTMAEYPDATISLEPGYDINFCSDDSTILAVADNAAYNYQWQLNGVNIYGETGHSITVKGPTGEYSVWVENPVSGCISEDRKTVTVRTAPAAADINMIGEDEFCERDSSMLYISDSPGISYQWLLNGGEVGNNDHIYFAKDAGYYTCKRTNEYGCSSISSNGMNISVIPGPATPVLLLSGPTMFCEGQTLTLDISDPGTDSYQWLKDDISLAGETGTSLTIDKTGHFRVRASNGACESYSQGIVTTVSAYPDAPVIVTENYEEGACQGEDPITLMVESVEQSALYLWKRNGEEISGATGRSFTEFLAEGEYLVEVLKNGCGTESEVQTIDYGEMPERPEITVRGPVVWYLVCSNENADEYRWYFNEERVEDADEVLFVAGDQEGRYEVAISDGSKCFSRSDPVWIPLSTGIESDPFSGLKIYPNPSPGMFTIEMDNALMGELLIDIFTGQGSKILNIKFKKETTHFEARMDLSAQPSGTYLIKLMLEEYRASRSLIVE